MFTPGLVLKLLRESRDLKQSTLVERVDPNDKGEPFSVPTLSKAENDDYSEDTLKRILKALGLTVDEFNNLVDRLNAAWRSPDPDVKKRLEDAAFWHQYTNLETDEWRQLARNALEAFHRMKQDAIDRRRRRNPP